MIIHFSTRRSGRCRNLPLPVVLMPIALLAGCAADDASRPRASVRDSAGIRIVEHPADYEAPSWQVADAPLLSIGSSDDDTTTLLYQVEGAHHLSDGRLVVANRSTHELRFYDKTGSHLYSSGREGEGPGEFGYIAWIAVCQADSIFTWDITTRRLSVFDDRGTFVRSVQSLLPGNVGPYGSVTCSSNGTFLFSGRPEPLMDPGPSRPSRALFLVASDGTTLQSLGDFPGGERYTYQQDGRVSDNGPRPLGKETSHVIGNGRFYLGTSDDYEIRAYTFAGELEMLIRWIGPDLAMTQDHIDHFVSAQLDRAPNDNLRRSWARLYDGLEFPDRFPAHGRFVLDKAGNLWVEDYVRPGDEGPPVWNVFGPEGVQIAAVSTPAGLNIYEIGADYLLGTWKDELDVEYVRIYTLLKPGSER